MARTKRNFGNKAFANKRQRTANGKGKASEEEVTPVPSPSSASESKQAQDTGKGAALQRTSSNLSRTDSMSKKILEIAPMAASITARRPGCFRISSFNVNGLRAILRNEGYLQAYMEAEAPDVLCLNETKISPDIEEEFHALFPGYTAVFNHAEKKGYSGTAMFFKNPPLSVSKGIGVKEHDNEGRVITAEFPKFYVVATYVPNSGGGLVRLPYRTKEWDLAMLKYLKSLEEKKPVVWCGDLNVAHLDIDIHNPKGNRNKSPGFCDEERDNMSLFLKSGLIDWWREKNPDTVQYTYWGYRFNARASNKGWRLDYVLASECLRNNIEAVEIRSDVMGSDHCPVVMDIRE